MGRRGWFVIYEKLEEREVYYSIVLRIVLCIVVFLYSRHWLGRLAGWLAGWCSSLYFILSAPVRGAQASPGPSRRPSPANTFVIIALLTSQHHTALSSLQDGLDKLHLPPTFFHILAPFCLAMKTFKYFGKEIWLLSAVLRVKYLLLSGWTETVCSLARKYVRGGRWWGECITLCGCKAECLPGSRWSSGSKWQLQRLDWKLWAIRGNVRSSRAQALYNIMQTVEE